MSITIWHNPRCSKSRATLALLQEKGVKPDVVLYLENPPGVEEIEKVLSMLGLEPLGLMRKGEEVYKTLDLGNSKLTRDQLVSAMAKNPILIERPVVIHGKKAAIGRPPENVLEIL